MLLLPCIPTSLSAFSGTMSSQQLLLPPLGVWQSRCSTQYKRAHTCICAASLSYTHTHTLPPTHKCTLTDAHTPLPQQPRQQHVPPHTTAN